MYQWAESFSLIFLIEIIQVLLEELVSKVFDRGNEEVIELV